MACLSISLAVYQLMLTENTSGWLNYSCTRPFQTKLVDKEYKLFFRCQFSWNLQLIDRSGRDLEKKFLKLLERTRFNQTHPESPDEATIFPSG